MNRKWWIIGGIAIIGIITLLYFVLRKDLSNHIIIPYIAHQKPVIDPHLPHNVALSDKLDEVLFEGLFNISATPSGVLYEDGLGELVEIINNQTVVIRLKTDRKWHSSYNVIANKNDITVTEKEPRTFTAQDLRFTLRRIQQLGSLSPDYILVSQALENWDFEGPDNNNEVIFRFKPDREWKVDEVKDVLSFKIIPHDAELAAAQYDIGTGPYLAVPTANTPANAPRYFRNPASIAQVDHVDLRPFVDNSTFTTELKNKNINVLLETPFGAISPILHDPKKYFTKSNISTTFFAVLFNTQRLNREQRKALRALLDNRVIMQRFYKIGTPQQRNIEDYKGNKNNYDDYLNYSVFPSSSYYVEEKIVRPLRPTDTADLSILPDSIRIVGSLNYQHREEFGELLEILNDRSLFGGKIRAAAVGNEDIKRGNYDAVLVAIDGYKSTFLFNLYDIFLREPDFENYKINLVTETNAKGETVASSASFNGRNFCRIDASLVGPDKAEYLKFLEYMYGFMYTNHIGDKQVYAGYIDEIERELALGAYLFSLPSLAYFSTQFDPKSIQLYGVASQLSTIEKWQENKK
jgi:hypothetical protein